MGVQRFDDLEVILRGQDMDGATGITAPHLVVTHHQRLRHTAFNSGNLLDALEPGVFTASTAVRSAYCNQHDGAVQSVRD